MGLSRVQVGPKREAGVRLVGTEEEGWICTKDGRVGDERGASNKWDKMNGHKAWSRKHKTNCLGAI